MGKQSVAILGGSGAEGGGLALRIAAAGYKVIIGSREPAKAQDAAKKILERLPKADVSGADNQSAASAGEIVILAVPFAAQRSTLESVRSQLQGKILVDVTVPLVPPKVSQVQWPADDSAVVGAQKLLGDGVKVVSAFQNVSATHLKDPSHQIDCDVLVCGDDRDAREAVGALAERIPNLRAVDAGPLRLARPIEAITAVLVNLNRRHRAQTSIKILGLGGR